MNARNEVIYQSQAMTDFIKPLKGVPSASLDTYLHTELRLPVQTVIDSVRQTDAPVTLANIIAVLNGTPGVFDIIGQPMTDRRVMIALHRIRQRGGEEINLSHRSDWDREALASELLLTRKRLTSLQREHEIAGQEQRSTNEQLLSMNEELHSSNEELETSREELQSINEEHQTINAELAANNRMLIRANSDLKNLLESTDFATLFLDSDHCIRLFTPEATQLFSLRDCDIGRSIHDLTARVTYPQLRADADEVERSVQPVSREVTNPETGQTYLARLLPSTSTDDELDGCVLTFVDITERKRTERQLAENADRLARQYAELESLYDTTPVGLSLMDPDLNFLRVNETLAAINGMTVAQMLEGDASALGPDLYDRIAPLVRQVVETAAPVMGIEIEGEISTRPGERRVWIADYYPVKEGDRVVAVGAAVREITEERRLKQAVLESETRMRRLFDQAPAIIAITEGAEHRYIYFNAAHDEAVGGRVALGQTVVEALPELEGQGQIGSMDGVFATGTTVLHEAMEVHLNSAAGTGRDSRFFRQAIHPWFRPEGGVGGLMLLTFEVTNEVRARREAQAAHALLQNLQDSLLGFVGILTPEGVLVNANQPAIDMGGLKPEDVIGKKFWDCNWWSWNDAVRDRLQAEFARAILGEIVHYDAEVMSCDGQTIIIDFQLVPIFDDTGQLTTVVASGIDITQRIRAERDLRRALSEQQAFFDNSPIGLAMLDVQGDWLRVNPAFAALHGLPVEEHSGKAQTPLLPDPDGPGSAVAQIVATGEPLMNRRVRAANDNHPHQERDFSVSVFPIRNDDEIWAVGSSVQDITDRVAAEKRQALLIAELQHRVKNTLATVQSVARFTARHSVDKEAMVASLQSRLASIARTHDALTQSNWEGQYLQAILRAEVLPYDNEDNSRITITGPDVLLGTSQAMSCGLAFHELATNAAKYGALGHENGTLAIDMETDARGGLKRLTWRETGAPMPKKISAHEGFGTFLLKSVLSAEMGAKVTLDYLADGLQMTLEINPEKASSTP